MDRPRPAVTHAGGPGPGRSERRAAHRRRPLYATRRAGQDGRVRVQATAAHRRAQAQRPGPLRPGPPLVAAGADLLDAAPPAPGSPGRPRPGADEPGPVEDEVGGDGGPRCGEARELAGDLDDAALGFGVASAVAIRALRRGRARGGAGGVRRRRAAGGRRARRDACNLYLNRGNLHLQRLELAAARRDLERSVRLAEGTADDSPRRVASWPGTTWATWSTCAATCRGRCS